MKYEEIEQVKDEVATNLCVRLKQVQKFKQNTAKRIKEQALILCRVMNEYRDANPETFMNDMDFMIRIHNINDRIRQYERLDSVEEELLMILGDEND